MSPGGRPGGSTFRARLTLGMTLLSLVVLATASTAIYLWARESLRATFDSVLFTVAQIEVASAIDEPGGPVHPHESLPVPLPPGAGPAYEKVVRIRSQDGTIDLHTINLERGPRLQTDPASRRAPSPERCPSAIPAVAARSTAASTIRSTTRRRATSSSRWWRSRRADPLERTLWSLLGALGASLVVGGLGAAWVRAAWRDA